MSIIGRINELLFNSQSSKENFKLMVFNEQIKHFKYADVAVKFNFATPVLLLNRADSGYGTPRAQSIQTS